ncbi:YceI family protein [Sphaerisporangium sp. NPDC005289]|uniref:YceI family protein n=1 Tax=Sphaerisporangium sp. NPDC005289 TaxID=3155247 RepID=UPI0033BD3EFB
MTPQIPTRAPERPRRERHWIRWTLIGIATLVVVTLVTAALAVKLQPTPAPLTLPASAAAPVGPLDGTWQVSPESVAGFRVEQTVLGLTSDVVGRTEGVTGSVVIAHGRVTEADLRIDLRALTSDDKKPAPQFGVSLETGRFPDATVGLARPVSLNDRLAFGAATTVSATGRLTLHGVTREVTTRLSARRDATDLRIAGSIPVAFADWGIARPVGVPFFGDLADHGVAEFLLVLRHG